MRQNRERAVGLVASLMLTFTAWAWGGVVLWTQWATAGLGLLALVIALLPSTLQKWQSRPFRLSLVLSIAGGGAALVFSLVRRLLDIRDLREDTLQLIPNAEFPPLSFKDWGEQPLIIGLGSALFLALLTGLARPSGARRRLIGFPLFWLGLFLFVWIACQSLNPWGKVIQRDLFWQVIPQDYIRWLPSGLSAPFDSSEEPGGMNGWRQLLILVGPWALLCALRISIERRRVYMWLALIAMTNGLALALVGNIAMAQKWADFLGYAAHDFDRIPFGPFVYKNHAGAYMYICAGLAFAAGYNLAKAKDDKADLGGPFLVVAFFGVLLVLGAISTLSLGSAIGAGLLTLVVVPLAFACDRQIREGLLIPAAVFALFSFIVLYFGLGSTVGQKWHGKISSKQKSFIAKGEDDRAPLRDATWLMINEPSAARSISGWGGGTFRWISPEYMSKQQEFLSKDGKLRNRATHAHNDWLQSVAEWGLAGWVLNVSLALMFLMRWTCVLKQRDAVQIVLIGCLSILALHAYYDFFTFTPLLTLVALLVAWLLRAEREVSEQLQVQASRESRD